MSDEAEAVGARLELKCQKRGHLITTLWQTGPGAEPQIIEHGRIKPWDHDGAIFERPCPECGALYGRSVESLKQKIAQVAGGTSDEWTLLYVDYG